MPVKPKPRPLEDTTPASANEYGNSASLEAVSVDNQLQAFTVRIPKPLFDDLTRHHKRLGFMSRNALIIHAVAKFMREAGY